MISKQTNEQKVFLTVFFIWEKNIELIDWW